MKDDKQIKKVKFQVPIFDTTVVVVITNNIPIAYKREFGVEIDNTRMACLGYKKRKFGLFLEPEAVSRREIIAHEIFHMTHRMLEMCCMNFDEGHHEMGAYLCEYLTKRILAILKI